MFIVKKKINGGNYYYLNQSQRVDGKVKTKSIAYLGKNKEEAEKKAKKIKENMKEKNINIELERKEISIEELTMFCKRKGFVFSSGEIYGGLSGFWDFGHLGLEIKKNIKEEWWKVHVSKREDVVGIDGSIITSPEIWKASGHLENFSDIFVICKKCKKPSKIDKSELGKIKCECGGEFDEKSAKNFELMFKTIAGENKEVYLRPETAQLIFANFKNIYDSSRLKLPFGIAQIGKSFRNEISPKNFLFRSREFEQMEMEYFIKFQQKCEYEIEDIEILVYSENMQLKKKEPEKMKISNALNKKIIRNKWHAYWLSIELNFFKNLGANMEKFRIRQHLKDDLSHYSSDTWDLEYNFPFGWKELEGIADRGNYDLSQHQKFSEKSLEIFDEETKKKILPEVICEPSLGVERAMMVFLIDSYFYDKKRNNIVLKLNPKLAPIKAAIFPIIKKPEFEKLSKEIYEDLREEFNVIHDISGSIGRRYSRNDEIGTPFCITVDENSIKNKEVTIRDRDTTKQIRVKIKDLKDILRKSLNNEDVLNFGKEVNTRVK
jgi:glycyl-tRNA synthetase